MFDLSQFDKAPTFAPDNQIGVVLSLPLACIIEDPTQPRTEFDAEELTKLSEDIARRGVQAPIAVRPPIDGIYQIIHGARRFRASSLARLETIPAIVQPDEQAFDDYSQVLENTQRDNLTPLDIARFIQKRKALGESNSQIARNLSEKPEWVTYHLAFIDMPDGIRDAYEDGRIKGAKAVYELCKLQTKNPKSAIELLASGVEITRSRIADAMKETQEERLPVANPMPGQPDLSSGDQVKQTERVGPTLEAEPETRSPPTVTAQPVDLCGEQHFASGKLTRPSIIGIYKGNPVQVLVQFKPSEPGVVWIRSPESDAPQEVLADQITLSRIEEATP